MGVTKMITLLTAFLGVGVTLSSAMICTGPKPLAQDYTFTCSDGSICEYNAEDCGKHCHCENGDIKCSVSSDCGPNSKVEDYCRVGPNYSWICDCSADKRDEEAADSRPIEPLPQTAAATTIHHPAPHVAQSNLACFGSNESCKYDNNPTRPTPPALASPQVTQTEICPGGLHKPCLTVNLTSDAATSFTTKKRSPHYTHTLTSQGPAQTNTKHPSSALTLIDRNDAPAPHCDFGLRNGGCADKVVQWIYVPGGGQCVQTPLGLAVYAYLGGTCEGVSSCYFFRDADCPERDVITGQAKRVAPFEGQCMNFWPDYTYRSIKCY